MARYFWDKPSTLPDRVELIDSINKQPVAEILAVDDGFEWKRNTTELLHGAPPSEGHCRSFAMAKRKVVDGLPDAPALR